MMTTVDAFYWVRLAREYKNGTYYEGQREPSGLYVIDRLRGFPSEVYKPLRVPAVSYLLAKLSGEFGGNIYITGVYLIAVLSGLFIVPLILYFARLGCLPAGILGGLIGSFSFIYLVRTSVARVDTDSLALGFPLLTSFFILHTHEDKIAGQPRGNRLTYIYAALAGITMMLMEVWYTVSEFTYLYLVCLVVYLVINKNSFKVTFLSALIFFYCSFLFSFNAMVISAVAAVLYFGYTYFIATKRVKPVYAAIAVAVAISAALVFVYNSSYAMWKLDTLIGTFSFIIKNYLSSDTGVKPSALTQVTELQHSSISEVFAFVLKNSALSAVGFIGFIIFVVYNFKKAIPILPVFLIGLIAFRGANRFAMYLAPFIGAGFGYLITVAAMAVIEKFRITKAIALKSIVYVLTAAFFILIINQTAFFFVPQPALNVEYYKAFKDIKGKLRGKPVILTWWDFGYALEDITGFATFHDGGIQHTDKTLYIAHALTSTSQPELYNITGYITGNGSTVTADDIIKDKAIDKPLDNVKNEDIYLLFTSDMIGKFQAMYNVRGIDTLRPPTEMPMIQPLSCQSFKNDVLQCYEVTVDLKAGKINNITPISKAVFVDNGYVVKTVEFGHKNGVYIELFASGNAINMIMAVNGVFFNSNLNQSRLLGNFDKSLFEEVYSAMPHARLFRVKTPVM